MKLTMNQMQQQALYAAQHKKCEYDIGVEVFAGKCRPLKISVYFWEDNEIKNCKFYNIDNAKNCKEKFNEAIKVINGEIDPFEEEK